jgi:hypothetical protein
MPKVSQKQRILKYMNDFGSITTYDAFKDIGCTKLTTRISELRQEGYLIIGTAETSTNRYGEKVTYNRYRLGGADAS